MLAPVYVSRYCMIHRLSGLLIWGHILGLLVVHQSQNTWIAGSNPAVSKTLTLDAILLLFECGTDYCVSPNTCQTATNNVCSCRQPYAMSVSALRQLLLAELGQRDSQRFSDKHLQNLIKKAYTDKGALQDATREGLQSPPALPAALVDKLLKAFGPSGNPALASGFCSMLRYIQVLPCGCSASYYSSLEQWSDVLKNINHRGSHRTTNTDLLARQSSQRHTNCRRLCSMLCPLRAVSHVTAHHPSQNVLRHTSYAPSCEVSTAADPPVMFGFSALCRLHVLQEVRLRECPPERCLSVSVQALCLMPAVQVLL